MGFLSKITDIINGPYRYRAGPVGLGVGVENLALIQPGLTPPFNFDAPRYNVRGSMNPFANATIPNWQSLPTMDLRGNGLFISGEWDLPTIFNLEGKGGEG